MKDKVETKYKMICDIHNVLLNYIRDREKDIFKYYGIVVSVFGGLGYLLIKVLSVLNNVNNSDNTKFIYIILILGLFVFSTIVLLWIKKLIYNNAYQYRVFQGILYNIENELGLTENTDDMNKIIPAQWNPAKKMNIDFPEIYKTHINLIIASIIVLHSLGFYLIIFYARQLISIVINNTNFFILFGAFSLNLIWIFYFIFYPRKYNFKINEKNKLDKIFKNINNYI